MPREIFKHQPFHRSRGHMAALPFSSYAALQDNTARLAPGAATSMVSNPADIMLAFNYAADTQRNRRRRLAIMAAGANWAQDVQDVANGIASGAVDPSVGQIPKWLIATARWRARQQHVEKPFVAAVGDVAAADALVQAEQKTGQAAGPEDESYLYWAGHYVLAASRKAGAFSQEALAFVIDNSPNALVTTAVQIAAKSWIDTVTATGAEALRNAQDKGVEFAKHMGDNLTHAGESIGITTVVVGGAVLLLGAMWFLPSFRKL